MSCECLKDFSVDLMKHYNGIFKKKAIVSIEIPTLLSFEAGVQSPTYSEATLKLDGQKKEEHVILKHSFCPFCGVKIQG